MEIGINISNRTHYEEQIKYFKKFGVTHTFVDAAHKELDTVMKCLKENAIICDTLHAPYKGINEMWNEGADGDKMLQTLMESVSLSEKYSVPVMVTHISSGRPMPPITKIGVERYRRLSEFAEERGIIIAFENLTFFENLDCIMNEIPTAKFCYDCGHEACRMTGIRYMQKFAARTVALHIHDNLCMLDTDNHFIPFDGKIDFETVTKDIAESGFDGTLMLELKSKKDEKYKSLTDEEYFEKTASAAKKLAQMVNEWSIKNEYN